MAPDALAQRLGAEFPRFVALLEAGRGEPVEHVLPGMTAAELAALEQQLGVSLPASYRRLLDLTRGFWLGGGVVQFGPQDPFFHRFPPLYELTLRQRASVEQRGGRWPPPSEGMLCFAEFSLEADGDQVLFDVNRGLKDGEYPVAYYSHEGSPASVSLVAATFEAWLEELLTHPCWTEDES
jgi:hypothetical protein